MNEQLGMLLLRKRRDLAKQSRVKPITKTQQQDYMRDFVKNNSASVYIQGWTMKKPTLDALSAKRANQGAPQVPAASSQVPVALSFPADVSGHAATSFAPTDISVPTVSPAHTAASVPAEIAVHTTESTEHVFTAFEHVSTAPPVAAPTPSSSRTRTLERMLKHGLEVHKLLVGGELTMAEQLVGFIKAALLNAQSVV
nr:hypothetical protein [Tanacetum cinerariifolium]